MDSSNEDGGGSIATCENYAHVLDEYDDAELTDILTVGTRWSMQPVGLPSQSFTHYKELQIHGDVDIAADVAELHIVASVDKPFTDSGRFAALWTARFGMPVVFVKR